MNDIRDIIQQWENVDRTRNDLRDWLHSKQEDLQEMEDRPAKLHAEAAELDIANLQVNNVVMMGVVLKCRLGMCDLKY